MPNKINDKFKGQSNSEKWVRNKKKNRSNEIAMANQMLAQRGYPQIKGALSSNKNQSLSESVQQTGRLRRKRPNSQWCSSNKRPKSAKSMPRGRKYKTSNPHNISVENKVHSISHSIDQSTLISNERPSSVIESLRYSKGTKKDRKSYKESNKESISTSIDVPMIELHNPDGSFQRMRHPPNNLIYRKAAEIISNNYNKNIDNIPVPGWTSNSHKILKSTSRSNKQKSKPKEKTHRKSKSDTKKIWREAFKNGNSKSWKVNPKLAKTNYIEQVLNKNVFYARPQDKIDHYSPMKVPQQAYILNHISQNWINNINQQIEENGKNLLESINKAKKNYK